MRKPKVLLKRPKLPDGKPVYVVGAGLSAGLGYPLVNDLLVRLWSRLSREFRADLRKVVEFHHPGFDPRRATSFPNIETLLSGMMVNERLFKASRAAPGRFTLANLRQLRRGLLLAITDWFHEILDAQASCPPDWISKFAAHATKTNAVIISFNWDLALDFLLFENTGTRPNYGVGDENDGPILLKPHGSLNWFSGLRGKRIKDNRKELLHSKGDDIVYRFRHFRAPRGKHDYMPLIIPPVFNKSFNEPILTDTWRRCVSELSRGKRMTFLGYSLPEADLHARFILRCGFENQIQGELLASGKRAKPTGPAQVTVVNPDLASAKRIEGAVGGNSTCKWRPMLAADWIAKALR